MTWQQIERIHELQAEGLADQKSGDAFLRWAAHRDCSLATDAHGVVVTWRDQAGEHEARGATLAGAIDALDRYGRHVIER